MASRPYYTIIYIALLVLLAVAVSGNGGMTSFKTLKTPTDVIAMFFL